MNRISPQIGKPKVRVFEKYGCTFKRQKDDHLIYRCPGAMRAVVIPKHREVSVTIILSNMKRAGMNREEYLRLHKSH